MVTNMDTRIAESDVVMERIVDQMEKLLKYQCPGAQQRKMVGIAFRRADWCDDGIIVVTDELVVENRQQIRDSIL